MSTTDPTLRRELAGWVFEKLTMGVDFDAIAAALEGTAKDVRVAAAEHDGPPEPQPRAMRKVRPQLQLTGRAR